MNINQVKQFTASNISRFEKNVNKRWPGRSFYLYDKNNRYRGEHQFFERGKTGSKGIISSLSATRIMNDKMQLEMQEYVHMNKDYVNIKDLSSELLTRPFPTLITTTRTVLDYVKDKFMTIRTTSKLQNELQKLGEDDPDIRFSEDYPVYEPLKEKPRYEKTTEIISEGSISEVQKRKHDLVMHQSPLSRMTSIHTQIPYIYW
jgi:hypothetical protein